MLAEHRPLKERLRELLEAGIERLGFELVDVEYVQGRRAVLRIYVDAPGGITLDDCEQVSHCVAGVLDVEDPISGSYTLEVSSPGLDRPLVRPEHFRRFLGRRVRVRLHEFRDGRRKLVGKLVQAEHDSLVLDVDAQEIALDYAEIKSANLVPEFGH